MGHVVPKRGHMNGVAIYPFDMSRYAYKAMLTRGTPFDVALSSEAATHIAPANALIAHVLKVQGGDAPFVLTDEVRKTLPSTAVLLHGYCTPPPEERTSQLTTVITNHGRPDRLWRAFQSCLASGLRNIVVVSTRLDQAVLDVHTNILRTHPATHILALKPDPGCTQAWLEGVRAATTKWVHILHDDDQVLPGFAATVEPALTDVRFLLFNAQFHEAQGARKCDALWARDAGIYDTAELRDRLLAKPRAISPISGVFERTHLEAVLTEFQRNCAHRSTFQLSPTMQVGNDLLIWLRATELEGKFRYITEPLVSYGHHAGSITVADQAAGRLPAMYQALKDYWQGKEAVTSPTTTACAIFCYVPDLKAAAPWMHHLRQWKHDMPLHCLVHEEGIGIASDFRSVFAPAPPAFQTHGGCLPSDQYAMLSFLHILTAAAHKQLTHFILIETDCRFAADYWDRTMWQEFKAWPTEALFGGTPVCWHPWSRGHAASQCLIDYAHRYQQVSGIAMAFEGAYTSPWGMAIYPNGALAVYNVAECLEYFADVLPVLKAAPHQQGPMLAPFHTYDLHIGRRLVARHGVAGALTRLAWTPSTYSGCKNHHVTLDERLEMLRSGRKTAVHHIKLSESPL